MRILRLYIRVIALLGEEARLAWFLAGASVALALAQFVEPILFGKIVDSLADAQGASQGASWAVLLPLVTAWVCFGLFTIGASTMVALHSDRLAHRHSQVVRAKYFEHILQLPLSFHTGTHSGRLMKVMLTGTYTLWSLWLAFFRDHFTNFVSLFVLMPLTLFLNWRYGLLLIGLCGIFALLIALVLQKSEGLQQNVERHYTDMAERTSDTLGNIALVQSFARIEVEVSALRKVGDQLLGAQMPVLSWWAVAAVATRAATTLTILAILILGIFFYSAGETTVGEIVMFMSFSTLLIGKLEAVVHYVNTMVLEAPRLGEFFDVLDTEPAVRDRPDAIDPGRLRGLVEFKDVSYSYDGKRPAVADLNFTVLPGETIAFVGPTGAGKSTALALLHRVFDPQSGMVKIDGMDVRGLKLSGLRHNIGVVFQEALLFNRSIAENLAVGKPDASEEEMREAARRAQALEVIERNSDGLNATVGERGRLLSGGERQRLSIARALLKDPPILILDEATSSLDAITEAKVQAALDEVMKGRTTFVIAHRLATVRNATRIMVFQNARLIECGTFDELVRRGGHFAELARTQFMVRDHAAEPTAVEHAAHDRAAAARAHEAAAEEHAAAAREHEAAADEFAASAAEHEATSTEHEATWSESEATPTEHEATSAEHEATWSESEATSTEHEATWSENEAPNEQDAARDRDAAATGGQEAALSKLEAAVSELHAAATDHEAAMSGSKAVPAQDAAPDAHAAATRAEGTALGEDEDAPAQPVPS